MFAADCQPRSEQALAALRAELGIKTAPPRRRAAGPTTPEHASAFVQSGLPVRVAAMLGRIDRAGIKVTEALKRGENPFKSSPAFLRVTCHLVLHLPAGLTREQLKGALVKKLDWAPATAAAHAIQACQILVALGACEEENGRLRIKK